jgi:hypothetical protein
MKNDYMMGADDGSSENPPSDKPKPMGTGLLRHPVNPLNHGQVGQCKIQAVVRNKRNLMHISKGYNDKK